MKKTTILIMTTAAIALSGVMAASAHDGGGKGGRGGFGGGFGGSMKGSPLTFAEIDTNSDGQITVTEFEAVKSLRFAKVDTDGNGEISAEEMIAQNPNMDANRAASFVALFDTDNSGGVSLAEMPARDNDNNHAQMMVLRLDANGDGQISEEEYNAAPQRGRNGGKPSGNQTAPTTPTTDENSSGGSST